MRPKSLILLGLALGCGLVASIGINQVMANRNSGPTAAPLDGTEVFVALTDIGLGDPISAAVLKLEKWPSDKMVDGMISKLEEVEGRRSRQKIFAGEPILQNKLLKKGETGASATDLIPPGFRAVSISVDAVSGSSGMILPGDRVDLLVHIAAGSQRGIERATTCTFLQNVKVFAVDDNFSRAGDETTATAKTISVLVTPEQAQLVMLAVKVGTVQLVMRSASDDAADSTAVVDVQTLLHGHNSDSAPAPEAALPPGSGLLSLLNQQKAPPPEPTRAAPRNVFTMVVIKGADMSKAEFADGKAVNLPDQADSPSAKGPALPLLPPVPPKPETGPTTEGGDKNAPGGKSGQEQGSNDGGEKAKPPGGNANNPAEALWDGLLNDSQNNGRDGY